MIRLPQPLRESYRARHRALYQSSLRPPDRPPLRPDHSVLPTSPPVEDAGKYQREAIP